MKKLICAFLALAVSLALVCAANAEILVDESGNPWIDYPEKEVYDQILYGNVTVRGIISQNGSSGFDFNRFANSTYGRSYAVLMKTGVANPDAMGEGILEYFRSIGVEKKIYYVDNSDTATAYYVYAPAELEEGKQYPVVVCNHGSGSNARSAEVYGWCEMAGSEGLIAVIPEIVEVDSLHTMLEQVKAAYPVDTSRVYMVGNSRGGRMSRMYAGTYPNEIAAIAPVSNSFVFDPATDGSMEQLSKFIMPMIFVGGTADVYNVLMMNEANIENWNNLVQLHGFDQYKTTYADSLALRQQSLNVVESYTGLPLPEAKIHEYVNTRAFQCDFTNADGITTLSLVIGENHPHFMLKEDSEIIWNFIKQYARNNETGELIILK